MSNLDISRKNIERIDKEIADMFVQRMEQSKLIAQHKAKNHLPVRDIDRELELIDKNCAYIKDDTLKIYYKKFLKSLIDISCDYQQELMSTSAKH